MFRGVGSTTGSTGSTTGSTGSTTGSTGSTTGSTGTMLFRVTQLSGSGLRVQERH